ncbi:hypothetical protein BGX38DRAFT_1165757 [Terfezia claveryi]|nr:hypothetical protein BGX38DRAFT_1165757 [Terfezia claveryi]
MPEPIESLPFSFRRTPEYQAPGLEYPPQAQPRTPLTPQKQKVRQPTVEEVAVPRCRTKTTGDIPRVWASPSKFDSPCASLSSQQQTTPLIKIQTPAKTKWATSPPSTPPRRYTPQVTDFALPRHRRYRLSLQWKPRIWDEEDLKPRRRRRYTDGMVDRTKTERAGEA